MRGFGHLQHHRRTSVAGWPPRCDGTRQSCPGEIGLRLHSAKYGVMLARFLGSLNAVLLAARVPKGAREIFESPDELFIRDTIAMLNARRPQWRTQIAKGEALFPLQTPEIWSALYELAAQPTVTRPLRPRISTQQLAVASAL